MEDKGNDDLQLQATEAVLTYIEHLPTSHPDYEFGLQFIVSTLNSGHRKRQVMKAPVLVQQEAEPASGWHGGGTERTRT